MNKADVEINNICINAGTYKNEQLEPNLINFFFGNNGTGKSTVAKEIYKEKDNHLDYEFLIYNVEYKNKNLQELNGIFTLNEENIEIETQIKELKTKIKEIDKDLENFENSKSSLEANNEIEDANFKDNCKNKCKDIQIKFTNALTGAKQINSLLSKIENVVPVEHNLNELQKLYDIAYSTDDTTLDLLEPTATSFKSVKQQGYNLLNTSIVSSEDTNFSSYLKRIDAFDWVLEGHKKYHNISENKCPYCQRELTDEIKQKLNECFNEEFENNIKLLTEFANSYRLEWQPIFNKLRRNESKRIPDIYKDVYRTKLQHLELIIKHNLSEISLKEKEPSKKVTIDDLDKGLVEINDLIKKINNEITNYNNIVLTKKDSKKECTNKIYEYIKFLLNDDIDEYESNIESNNEEIQEYENKISNNKSDKELIINRINELNSQTINTTDVVNKINNLLTISGFQGFKLIESPSETNVSKYAIIRDDGSIATNLSEGEENFISFLYFYFQVKYSSSITPYDKKIVIIDDPVSSMDTNSLYIISSLVREMIDICSSNYNLKIDTKYGDYIHQLFIFTHNIYFHNEISQNQVKNDEYVSFFIITKENNISKISECINENADGTKNIYNPVGNSYTLLWQEYKECISPTSKLNIIKRILDYYFIQFSGFTEDSLIEKIEKNDDKFITKDKNGNVIDSSKLNIARALINQVSAYGRFNEDIYFSTVSKETISTFEYVFELIFEVLGQKQHYNMMMGESD